MNNMNNMNDMNNNKPPKKQNQGIMITLIIFSVIMLLFIVTGVLSYDYAVNIIDALSA